MPNRYIREGINSSRAIASLDAATEVFYRRMLLVIDDFGRYEVDYLLIRSAAYPVHNNIRETDIARWMAACQKAGLLAFYESGGRQYMVFTKTEPPRAKHSRYPDPPPELVERLGLFTPANICSHVQTNAPNTNTNTDTNANANTNAPPPRAREDGCECGVRSVECGVEHSLRAREDIPVAEIPSWDEFWAYCQSLHCGLGAEWFARDKWEAGNQGHWRKIIDWRAYARRCRAWWDAKGRPMAPPSETKGANVNHANNRNAYNCTTGPDRNAGTYNAHYDTEAAKCRIR